MPGSTVSPRKTRAPRLAGAETPPSTPDRPTANSENRNLSSGARFGLAYLLFALATLACLAMPVYRLVFPDSKSPLLIGPDPYFHLRHIKAVLANYPVVAREDLMVNFPNGEQGLNQGFFDVTVATAVKLSAGLLSPEAALAWVSPLCHLLACGLGFLWFWQRGNERCGYLFLLFCVFYPGPVRIIAALGHGDHHAFEILLAVLVAWSLDYYLRPDTSWRWAPLAVAPLLLFYLSWAGAPLHLFLTGLAFYLRAWVTPAEKECSLAIKGLAYGLLLLLATILTGAIWPWAVIWHVSEKLFRLGAVALVLGYPLLVPVARRQWRQPALVATSFLLGALALAYLTPTGHSAINALLERRTLQIAEHSPASVPLLLYRFGFLWLVALAAPLRIWQRQSWQAALVPFTLGAGLVFFWLQTYDFNYYAPIVFAAGAAYTLGTQPWRKPLMVAVATLALMPLAPKLMEHPWIELRGIREGVLLSEGLQAASDWLKDVQGPASPPEQREYGLVAPWDLGNILAETADTPVGFSQTVSRELARLLFSDQPDQAYGKMVERRKPFRYLLLPARNLAEKLLGESTAADLKIGDLLGPGPKVPWKGREVTFLQPTQRNRQSLLNRLYWDNGDGIGHFRLVYESPQQAIHLQRLRTDGKIEFYAWPATAEELQTYLKPLLDTPDVVQETSRGDVFGGRQAAEVRIFEAVPGALLEGTTRPGAQVVAALSLKSPTTNRRWTGVWTTEAADDGRFSLRVPYSTTKPLHANSDTVTVQGPYKVTVDRQQTLVAVSEEDVQAGRTLPVR